MYLEIFLADFAFFWEFRGISRKYLNFAGPRPREISEALYTRQTEMRIQRVWQKSLKGFSPGVQLFVDTCIIKPGCLFACCGCKIEKASDSFLLLPFIFPIPIQIHFFCLFIFFSSPQSLEIQKNEEQPFLKNINKSASTYFEHLEQAVTLLSLIHIWRCRRAI